jgi:enoyl-CoA hydratase/carnithine racemase
MTTSTPHSLGPELLERAGLRYEVDGPVATITLDRPRTKNSQTPATWFALNAIGNDLDPAVRVVVVRGAGDMFSSGLDRKMLSLEGVEGEGSFLQLLELDDDDLAETIAGYQEAFTWLRRSDIISIAAVQGHAIGAGFQLALSCDLRVLADDAQLTMREAALGLVPDLTGTKPLVELVGYSRALEICITARLVDALEAREIGLANVVVPRSELEQTVADLVAAILEPMRGAVSEIKALVRSAGENDLETQRKAERTAQVRRFRDLAATMGP